jgi:hypothetical protein
MAILIEADDGSNKEETILFEDVWHRDRGHVNQFLDYPLENSKYELTIQYHIYL